MFCFLGEEYMVFPRWTDPIVPWQGSGELNLSFCLVHLRALILCKYIIMLTTTQKYGQLQR